MLNLAQAQKFELAEKLLACPQLATASGRVTVAGQLSASIKTNIRLGAINTPKEEVLALVDAAASVEQGIAELTSVLAFFDGGSLPFEAVQVYVDALGFGGLLPFNSNLLPARNPKFVGREKELASLHKTLQDTSMIAVTALHGLGGVGKTSLAIEYLYRHQKAYNLIVWLPAENKLTLELEFIGLLGVLGLPDMPIDTEENRARAVAAVKKELARRGKGWLLVFDNAERVEDVAAFRPCGAGGHVIVTSRNIQMGKLGSAMAVDVLTEGDALRLLAAYCYPAKTQSGLASSSNEQLWQNIGEAETAEQLVLELGYLALAIIQAGSYVQATGISLQDYLIEFRQLALELFGEDFAKPTDYPATVATTWELAFTRIKEQNQAAADLLNLLAFFAPNNIKLAWFTTLRPDSDKIIEITGGLPENLAEFTTNKLKLNRGLALLQTYSLLAREGDYLAVHRLVQLVTRHNLGRVQVAGAAGEGEGKQVTGYTYWLNQVVAFLLTIFPDENNYQNWTACSELIGHLQSVLDHYASQEQTNKAGTPGHAFLTAQLVAENEGGIDIELIGGLYARAASYYHERTFYSAAKPLYERGVAIARATLGNNHPELATRLNNFAGLLQHSGDSVAARQLCEEALAINRKTLGKYHLATAHSLNNLAALYHATGDYAAALPLFERAIAIRERKLGREHPHVATSLNHLASLLQDIGDYPRARLFYERAIAIREKSLDSNHLDLATSFNDLTSLLEATGDYQAARHYCEKSLAITEKTLGSEHPKFAVSLGNLGTLLYAAGNNSEARLLFERAIGILEKTPENDPLELATIYNNLALAYQQTGKYEQARQFFEKALAIGERLLNKEHPKMLIWLSNRAGLLCHTKDYAEAKLLYERVISATEKTPGREHPVMATRLTNLANLLGNMGDYREAFHLYNRALAIREKTEGLNHPATAVTLNNMGWLLEMSGEPTQALPMYKKALTIFQSKLGTNHPDTSRTAEAVSRLEVWLNSVKPNSYN